MDKINTRKLNSIGTRNLTARNITHVLVMRERVSKFTNLAGFRYLMKKEFKLKFKRQDFDQYWRDLAQVGLGKLIYSAQKVPLRYDWAGWDSRSVGLAIQDPAKHPERAHFRNRKRTPKKEIGAVSQPMVATALPVHEGEILEPVQDAIGVDATKVFAVFQTQNFEAIQLELNRGLTRADKEKFIAFLNRLPVREAS